METLEEFYKQKFNEYPGNIFAGIGQFNVFRIEDRLKNKEELPLHVRRNFFKIMLFSGKNSFKYGNELIRVSGNTLLFFHPDIPYSYQPLSPGTKGYFCVFRNEFFQGNHKLDIGNLFLFRSSVPPVFRLSRNNYKEVEHLFLKMLREKEGNFIYKYELIKNHVSELYFQALKWMPTDNLFRAKDAPNRVSMVFLELLEKQFPIQARSDAIKLRLPAEYAKKMFIHVNYLNRCVKMVTGKTTRQHISERRLAEAKILLKHTDWSVSEISEALLFEDPAHFNKFFNKHTGVNPSAFRLV